MLLFPPPGKLDPKKFPAIAVLAKRQGDAEKGRKLLAATLTNEAQCLKCHTVRGVGGQVGPDLSMIGKKASRENLIESILLPSKAIADQFIQWRVETKNGQDITGLLIEETKESLLLRDANAKDHRIPIANIESRAKSTVSIMPENIVAALTEDELIDLVEYLATLNTASFTPDTWLLAGPFAANGNDGLDKDFGPERAFNGAATFETKSGKVGWRTVRRADNGYIDLAAFHGDPGNNSVSYAYREIESPVDQEAEIALGTDDGGKLWVNGKEVFALKTTRAAAAEQNRVKVPLIKGRNTILLKIANGNNPHGFYCTIRTEQEVK
jgi:putative heme-binding domain-containing protein